MMQPSLAQLYLISSIIVAQEDQLLTVKLTAMIFSLFIAYIVSSTAVQAQSLLNATAGIPALSNFNELLSTFPELAAGLLTNISTGLQRQTILVPSNDAFDSYRQQNGASVSSLSSSDVGNILNYHTLPGALSSSDLQQPDGLVSETALRNPTYARRENATDAGDSLPQVVYIVSTQTATGRKIKARQVNALSSVDVRSGEGKEIELEQTPGNWSGVSQTDTMTSANLTSFVRGLARTNVTEGTNAARGLTCIMGFLNTTPNETTPADDPIYSDTANIPTPPPTSTAMTSSEGVIPTSNATGNEVIPSPTETSASSPTASGTGAAATTGSTGGTSAANSFKVLLTMSVVVGTAITVGFLAL
ncbi:MAG: hypothetical protein Q9213_007533 [Squamulea squamosa]